MPSNMTVLLDQPPQHITTATTTATTTTSNSKKRSRDDCQGASRAFGRGFKRQRFCPCVSTDIPSVLADASLIGTTGTAVSTVVVTQQSTKKTYTSGF
jgi:hypothetical protein